MNARDTEASTIEPSAHPSDRWNAVVSGGTSASVAPSSRRLQVNSGSSGAHNPPFRKSLVASRAPTASPAGRPIRAVSRERLPRARGTSAMPSAPTVTVRLVRIHEGSWSSPDGKMAMRHAHEPEIHVRFARCSSSAGRARLSSPATSAGARAATSRGSGGRHPAPRHGASSKTPDMTTPTGRTPVASAAKTTAATNERAESRAIARASAANDQTSRAANSTSVMNESERMKYTG